MPKHTTQRAPQPIPGRREVEIVHSSYQPSRAELEADTRIDATFEEAIAALVRPVKIRYIPRPKGRRG